MGLSGLPRITRCQGLRMYGAIAPPVEWTGNDGFCLDGEPLKPDSDGIYYYKFHFDGSRLRFDGTSFHHERVADRVASRFSEWCVADRALANGEAEQGT